MMRHVFAAVALVLILFGIGYGLRGCLVPVRLEQPKTQPGAAPPVTSIPKTLAASQRTIVTALSGLVELRKAAGHGWQPLGLNHELKDDDALRTSKGAHAQVAVGAAVRLEVSEQSEFTLSNTADDLSQLRLEGGRIAAHVGGAGNSRLRVEVRGSDAVAESNQAAFSMLRRADGQVTVAATEGSVGLRAHAHGVQVDAGQQSIVAVDQPPSEPKRIPSSLFLKVVRIGPLQISKRETEVGGATTPGAALTINGVPVNTDGQGRFKAKVALREGKNAVVVTAQDALGRTQEKTLPPIHVDTQAPKLGGEVVW
jgi:hypothetical protein